MSQTFWLFGSRLTIIADHTTTGGQYDLIEGYHPPNTQIPLHRHTRYSEQLSQHLRLTRITPKQVR